MDKVDRFLTIDWLSHLAKLQVPAHGSGHGDDVMLSRNPLLCYFVLHNAAAACCNHFLNRHESCIGTSKQIFDNFKFL